MTSGEYERLRSDLFSLADEFGLCRTSPLNHDLIWAPEGDEWDEREYAAFCEAHQRFDHVEWELWELWPNRRACSRFWAHSLAGESYVWEFKRKAERACIVLGLLQKAANESTNLPNGFRFWLDWLRILEPNGFTHYPWLELLHTWAYRFPTVHLRGECCWWNYSGPPLKGNDLQELMDREVTLPNGSVPYRAHPVCNKLDCNVFVASQEFIQICIESETTVPCGCFDGSIEIRLPELANKPYWDAYRGDLRFKDDLIKRFTKPATAQRKILDAFEENGWPHDVRNPFRMYTDSVDEANETCRNAVEALNDDHVTKAKLRFGTRSNRDIVYWQDITLEE